MIFLNLCFATLIIIHEFVLEIASDALLGKKLESLFARHEIAVIGNTEVLIKKYLENLLPEELVKSVKIFTHPLFNPVELTTAFPGYGDFELWITYRGVYGDLSNHEKLVNDVYTFSDLITEKLQSR
eukprot:NODE_83_length_22684_cov_0.307934.p14 type:complete len:127 gc:universal NODE_83_length_22684_cov_0.307934:22336-21956(-)